jgi:hypothetical protein
MLNATQVQVLRDQFDRIAEQGDEALVAFYEENHLAIEEVEDLAAKAADVYDRLKAKKAAEATEKVEVHMEAKKAKTEDQANQERRSKIANIFEVKGFDEAAVAVKMDLDGKDAKTLNEVVHVLDDAIPVAELYGWAKHYAYVHRNAAKKALDAMAEDTATKLFIWLSAVISRALRVLDSLKNARSDFFREGLVRQARQNLDEANGIRFQGWALAALERLMIGSNNPVVDMLRSDSDLAGSVGAVPDGRKAVALLDAMKNRVENRLASFHVGPMRSGKTQRDHAKNRK